MADLSILACYAHPDDEQGVTGTFRRYLEQGVRTGLVCATRGEVGEIADPSLATPETLGEVRESELRAALQVVGIPELYFLDYRDSGMDGTRENKDPRAFINADPPEAIGKLVKIIRAFRPTLVVTFDETGGYGHPDHLAINRWTLAAFNAAGDPAQYPDLGPAFQPARLFFAGIARSAIKQMAELMRNAGIHSVFNQLSPDAFGLEDTRITNRINVETYLDMKRESLAQHRTQNNPNGAFARMPEEAWRSLRLYENFAYVAGTPLPPDSDPEDLFAGLR
jgi:LmbE family N-acetylglucosaminyl deacetylase